LTAPRALVVTYALAAGGGAVATALRVPLGWLVGAMLATGAAAIAGATLRALPASRQAGQAVVGAALGLYFTPPVLLAIADAVGWMLAACAFALGVGAVGARLVQRRAGVGPATAFFACVPGGAAEMAILGERQGGDPAVIALSHAIRIVAVVTTVPGLMTLAGAHGADRWAAAALAPSAGGLAAMAAAGGGAGLALHLLRVPNAWLLGPLLGAGALAAAAGPTSAVPGWAVDAAQCLIGCTLGSRFTREAVRGAGALVAALILATAQAMVVMAAFAAAAAGLSGHPLATLVLATAPGGIAEMCLTARVLDLGVPLVTAFHLLRVAVLLTVAPLASRWLAPAPRPSGHRLA
jgi:membrane AbrB-like protein